LFLTETINIQGSRSLFFNYFVSCFNCVCEQISETTVCQVSSVSKWNAYSAQSKTDHRQETKYSWLL